MSITLIFHATMHLVISFLSFFPESLKWSSHQSIWWNKKCTLQIRPAKFGFLICNCCQLIMEIGIWNAKCQMPGMLINRMMRHSKFMHNQRKGRRKCDIILPLVNSGRSQREVNWGQNVTASLERKVGKVVLSHQKLQPFQNFSLKTHVSYFLLSLYQRYQYILDGTVFLFLICKILNFSFVLERCFCPGLIFNTC